MSDDRYEELLDEARELPDHSPLRIAVLEEAVREADRLADEVRGYEARRMLVRSGTFGGFEDRALVAFSWCLAYADRQDDDFGDWHSLLWAYKWIAGSLVDFPNVSREQIDSMEEDFGRRLEQHGYDLRPQLKIRWNNARAMGELDRAHEVYEQWRDTRRGLLSDCRACDRNAVVSLHVELDEDEQALMEAEPILAGELGCASVPHSTYATLLEPLAGLGRYEEADAYQKRGYRMISRNRDHLDDVGDHLLYLVHRENWDRGLRMVERHLGWALETPNVAAAFDFDRAAWMLFQRLAERGNRVRKLRTTADLPFEADDDRYRPSDLAAWFADRTRTTARRFDERNGNDSYQRAIARAAQFAGVEDAPAGEAS